MNIDNYCHGIVDFITLCVICIFGSYIVMKRNRHLKNVYIQLGLLLLAQILYTIRSSYRLWYQDVTYKGIYLPSWTASC